LASLQTKVYVAERTHLQTRGVGDGKRHRNCQKKSLMVRDYYQVSINRVNCRLFIQLVNVVLYICSNLIVLV
jgi:hypothetical protein